MSLKKLVLALFALACGGSPTNNNQDGSVDCKTNCDYSDGNSDGSLDDGNNKDNNTNGNNPPNIQFDPEMSRNVRVGTPKNLVAIVSDPDNDSVDCKFNFGDGTPETNYGSCSAAHTFSNTGQYSVSVTARDSKGLENSVSDTFTAYTNIPPHVVLDCPEVDPTDGLCVYRVKPFGTTCIDASGSYDEDGQVVLYKIQYTIDGPLTTTDENSTKCFSGDGSVPTVIGVISVKDNEDLWSEKNYRAIIE